MPGPANFDEVMAEVNQAFRQGDYTCVVEITQGYSEQYPEQKPVLLYMHMCAAARLDQKFRVYQVLERALDEGLWYSERVLRESPSLKPLCGQEEYEKLIAQSVQAAVQAAGEPDRRDASLIASPGEGHSPFPVLITFHANGSSARQAREDWQLLFEEGWLLLLLQSPNSLWKGAYNWEDEAGALEAAAGQYSRLTTSHSVDPSRIIAAGHSMGGKLAIELALSGKVPACGFIAVGPYISEDDIAALEVMAAKAPKLKGVILFGEADETIPHESIYTLAGRLEAHGHEVLVQHFSGIGHEFGAPIRLALSRAAGFILS